MFFIAACSIIPFVAIGQPVPVGTVDPVLVDPPFSGTIFIDPDIITESDPSAFESLNYSGQGLRTMFDRRVNAFISLNAYLFECTFDDGLTAEIQVNPEFGSAELAGAEAEKYAPVIGRLPTALRKDVQTVWIHKGVQPFGGGNNNLLIHVGQADLYSADGILEETLVHEASHTSLDGTHAGNVGWLAAQQADSEFISTYARDYPTREDIAESFLPYLAIRYRSDRISQELNDTIVQTIPNRITYFDALSLDMYPVQQSSVFNEPEGTEIPEEFNLDQNFPNPFNSSTIIAFALEQPAYLTLNVFNLSGRKVATLLSGSFGAGRYQIPWEADDIASGLYMYSLSTEKSVLSKTMLFQK